MKILAFDISSVKTGVALIQDGKIIKDGYNTIEPLKKLSSGAKLTFFQEALIENIKKYQPDAVAIEEIFKGRNMNTFKILAMYRGVAIKTIYEKTGKDPFSLSAVESRSILSLPISKEEMFTAAIKKYKLKGFDFEKDNDIVDAIILGMAIHTILKENDGKFVRSVGRRKKRNRKRNKK